MAIDKIILLNNKIINPPLKTKEYVQYDFFNYLKIYKFLLKHQHLTKSVEIYDITYNLNYPNNTLFSINDHINRIGHNPFIGKQKFFKIDFINIENLYTQHTTGVVTTCCGERYPTHEATIKFPSTHIANVATLAHISGYAVTGHLINQT